MRRIFLRMMIGIKIDLKQAQSNKNFLIEPGDGLNYAQYRYVGAHAAEKYPRFFPKYVLQEQPIPGMLSTGSTGS